MITVTTEVTKNEVPDHMLRAYYAAGPLFMRKMGTHLREYLSELAPRGQTGALKGSFHSRNITDRAYVWSDEEYAEGVDQGTGLYGPARSRIRPETAGALKFYWPKIGAMTVWKGDLPPGSARARFVAWALANNMVPFLIWPAGQPGQKFTPPAIVATEKEAYFLMRRSLKEMRAI